MYAFDRMVGIITSPKSLATGILLALPAIACAATLPQLSSVNFFGNSALSAARLQAAVRPILGQPLGPLAIVEVRQAVQRAYAEAGFGLVTVDPPVPVAAGSSALSVRIHEIRVSTVTVLATDSSEASVRAMLPALAEGVSPDLDRLALQTFLFNDNPRRRVAIDFQPDGPDQVTAVARVTESRPWFGSFGIDNSGTRETGRYRLMAAAAHANLLGRGILGEVSLTASPDGQKMRQAVVRLNLPIVPTGASVDASADVSRTDIGSVLNIFAVSGRSHGLRAAYRHPLSRTGTSEHSAVAGVEVRRLDDVIDFAGINLGNSVATRALSLGYSGSGRGEWAWAASASLTANVTGGDRNSDAAYAAARQGATAGWRRANASGSLWLMLPVGQLAVRGVAQASGDALISGEQVRFGGAGLLRGARESEVAGDSGAAVSLEWSAPLQAVRAFTFADAAGVARHHAVAGSASRLSAVSAGLGIRAATQAVAAELVVGHVLHARNLPLSAKGSTRVHASFRVAF